ncbi:helix-turn-helix domain-containing protein [Burkholderia multivorans]|uniref:helix-turn-helix domain-containing protein n=1 Tax=Burkholderia multivorans TaxID=87883 RepID=UPI001C227CE7|nr:helix-turn-helix domain-containing protein [Burkholderia multivorans]MBU9615220.1 helix-turn-helix domain-containing protein [Burkholderia multivorans]
MSAQSETPAVLMTTAQAAEYLGISFHTLEIWRSTRRYHVPFVKIGNRVRYRRADLDAWIASRLVEV